MMMWQKIFSFYPMYSIYSIKQHTLFLFLPFKRFSNIKNYFTYKSKPQNRLRANKEKHYKINSLSSISLSSISLYPLSLSLSLSLSLLMQVFQKRAFPRSRCLFASQKNKNWTGKGGKPLRKKSVSCTNVIQLVS